MVMNAVQGNPLHWGIGKTAVFAAASASIASGIGSIAKEMGKGAWLFQAFAHGTTGGALSAISSGDADQFLPGFAAGFVSSVVASAAQGLGNIDFMKAGSAAQKFSETKLYTAIVIASGAFSGGIAADIAGGNFLKGAVQGAIVTGLNHLGHSGLFDKHEHSTYILTPNEDGGYTRLLAGRYMTDRVKVNTQAVYVLDSKGQVIHYGESMSALYDATQTYHVTKKIVDTSMAVKHLRLLGGGFEKVGTAMEVGGLALTPITEGASLAFVPMGSCVSLCGFGTNMAADFLENNTNAAVKRGLTELGTQAAGEFIERKTKTSWIKAAYSGISDWFSDWFND